MRLQAQTQTAELQKSQVRPPKSSISRPVARKRRLQPRLKKQSRKPRKSGTHDAVRVQSCSRGLNQEAKNILR